MSEGGVGLRRRPRVPPHGSAACSPDCIAGAVTTAPTGSQTSVNILSSLSSRAMARAPRDANAAALPVVFRTHSDAVSRCPFLFCPRDFGLPDIVDMPPLLPRRASASAAHTTAARTTVPMYASHSHKTASSDKSQHLVATSASSSSCLSSSEALRDAHTCGMPYAEAILELREAYLGDEAVCTGTMTTTTLDSDAALTLQETMTTSSFMSPLSSSMGFAADVARLHDVQQQRMRSDDARRAGCRSHLGSSSENSTNDAHNQKASSNMASSATNTRTTTTTTSRESAGLRSKVATATTSTSTAATRTLTVVNTPSSRPRMTPHGWWICRATARTSKESSYSRGAVSVHCSLASHCALVNDVAKGATMCRLLCDYADVQARYGLSHVELRFEHQYVSRADMCLIANAALRERIVYAGEELTLCGCRLRVSDLLRRRTPHSSSLAQTPDGQSSSKSSSSNNNNSGSGTGSGSTAARTFVRVGCGVVTAATCVSFCSLSPLHYLIIELAREMWHGVVDGRSFFAGALRCFVLEWLHVRLPQHKASPRLRVVLTGRLHRAFAIAGETDVVHTIDVGCVAGTTRAYAAAADLVDQVMSHCDAFVRRVLRAVAAQEARQQSQESCASAACTPHTFASVQPSSTCDKDGSEHNEPYKNSDDAWDAAMGASATVVREASARDVFVCAKHSNTLDVLALLTEQCTCHYRDRALQNTGHALTVVTAGKAVYAARNARVQQLTTRLYDVGVRKVNFVCLGLPAMHVSPLLRYRSTDASMRSQYHLYTHDMTRNGQHVPTTNNNNNSNNALSSLSCCRCCCCSSSDDDDDDDDDEAHSQHCSTCARQRSRRCTHYYLYEEPAWARALFYVPHTQRATAPTATAASSLWSSSFMLLSREAWLRHTRTAASNAATPSVRTSNDVSTTCRMRSSGGSNNNNNKDNDTANGAVRCDDALWRPMCASPQVLSMPLLPPSLSSSSSPPLSSPFTSPLSLRLPAMTPAQRYRCRNNNICTRNNHYIDNTAMCVPAEGNSAAAAAAAAVCCPCRARAVGQLRVTCAWYCLREHGHTASSSSSSKAATVMHGQHSCGHAQSEAHITLATRQEQQQEQLPPQRQHTRQDEEQQQQQLQQQRNAALPHAWVRVPMSARRDAVPCASVLVDSDVARGALVLELTLSCACVCNGLNDRKQDHANGDGAIAAHDGCRYRRRGRCCCCRWSTSLLESEVQWRLLMTCFSGSDDRLSSSRTPADAHSNTGNTHADGDKTFAAPSAPVHDATVVSSFRADAVFCRAHSGVARDATTLLLATHPSNEVFAAPTRVRFACDASLLTTHVAACCTRSGGTSVSAPTAATAAAMAAAAMAATTSTTTTTAAASAATLQSSPARVTCSCAGARLDVVVAHIQLHSHLLFAITPIDPMSLFLDDEDDEDEDGRGNTGDGSHRRHRILGTRAKADVHGASRRRCATTTGSNADDVDEKDTHMVLSCEDGSVGACGAMRSSAAVPAAATLSSWSPWSLTIEGISTAALFHRRWYYRHPTLPPPSPPPLSTASSSSAAAASSALPPSMSPSSASLAAACDCAWALLCSCTILPLYGVRAPYRPDSFYTVPPHQYTLSTHTLMPSVTAASLYDNERSFTSNVNDDNRDRTDNRGSGEERNGGGGSDGTEVRRRLCAFVLQRLQQQYQIIQPDVTATTTTTTVSNGNSSTDTALAWLWSHTTPTKTTAATVGAASMTQQQQQLRTSPSPPPPHLRIELSVGHQTHILKLSESGTTVAVTRILHRGYYSNAGDDDCDDCCSRRCCRGGDDDDVSSPRRSTTAQMTRGRRWPRYTAATSCMFRCALWNYLTDSFDVRRVSAHDVTRTSDDDDDDDDDGDDDGDGDNDADKGEEKEDAEAGHKDDRCNDKLRGVVVCGDDSSVIHRSRRRSSKPHHHYHHYHNKRRCRSRSRRQQHLPWESLDTWLQYYPDLPIAHDASARQLCAREVAVVLLPARTSDDAATSTSSAVLLQRQREQHGHGKEALSPLRTCAPRMPSFASFSHFITTRFSVYLSMRNHVQWHEDTHPMRYTTPPPPGEGRRQQQQERQRQQEEEEEAADAEGDDAVAVRVAQQLRKSANEGTHDSDDAGTAQALLVPPAPASPSPSPSMTTAILLQDTSHTYEVRTCYDEHTGRALCVDAPADERVMSLNAIFASHYHRQCCYTLRVRWLQCAASVVAEWYGAYMASATRHHMHAVPLTCNAHHDAVLDALSVYYSVSCADEEEVEEKEAVEEEDKAGVAAHAQTAATTRLCAALWRVLTCGEWAYYPEGPRRPSSRDRRRLVHASGLCYVLFAPTRREVARWCVNALWPPHHRITREHATLLTAFQHALRAARRLCSDDGSGDDALAALA